MTLQNSISKIGLLNPIIVTKDYVLLCGQRRLEACKSLGWTQIDAIIYDVKDPLKKLEIEAQENLIRKDFTQLDIERIIQRKKELMSRGFFRKIANFFKAVFLFIKNFFVKIFKKK